MRLYALLARLLLPAPFLAEYGDELIGSVATRLSAVHRPSLRAALLGREVVDLVRTAIAEWSAEVRDRRSLADANGAERAATYRGRTSMLESVIADTRHAVRRLYTRPTYALLALLTLALGVGGTAAIYGIARELLFDPLPYVDEDQVGVFWKKTDWTEEEFLHLRGRAPGFREVALYRLRDVIVREGAAPARLVAGVTASAELFDVLGTPPLLGRVFRTGDDTEGVEPVAVLSYGLWQEMGGSSSIVGTRLVLDGQPRTIVGVMPRGFWFPDPSVRLWTAEPLSVESRSWNSTLIGRAAPGYDVRAMTAPVASIAAMLDERFDYPAQWDKTVGAAMTPLRDDLVSGMRPALIATLGALALILLIACANVAALMLGQVDARAGEFAVRLALGANRRQLTQQIVVEAMVIALAAGAVATVLAWGGVGVLSQALPLGAWSEATSPDWTLFAASMAVATGAALLVVVVPIVSLWRDDLRATLGRARTGGIEGRGGRLENGLVIAEVALAVLIASGAAVLARSVANLYALDPGVRTEGVAVIDVTLDGGSRARMLQTVEELTAAIAEVPGVHGAGAAQKLPLRDGGYNLPLTIEGRPELEGMTTEYRIVTPGYLEAMGIEPRSGRTITRADGRDSEPVVVINEALADAYFAGVDPIGRRIGDELDGRLTRIVGVVANAAERQLTGEVQPVRYVALAQLPWVDVAQSLVLHTQPGLDPATLLDAARRTVERVAPGVAVSETTTMSRILDVAVGPVRQVMTLLSLLTALALTLGAVGIYGVIAHFAARRQRDWAIRIALGLPGARVIRHVLGHGTLLVALGIAFGVLGAAILGRLLGSFLYGVTPLDPLALAVACAALLAVGAIAAFPPARRAGRTDPAIALRSD